MTVMDLNKQTMLQLRSSVAGVWRRLPRLLLIDRVRWMHAFLLIGWAVAMIYLVIRVVWLVDTSTAEIDRQPMLQVEVIDELEVWLEERQTEREQDPFRQAGQYFAP